MTRYAQRGMPATLTISLHPSSADRRASLLIDLHRTLCLILVVFDEQVPEENLPTLDSRSGHGERARPRRDIAVGRVSPLHVCGPSRLQVGTLRVDSPCSGVEYCETYHASPEQHAP